MFVHLRGHSTFSMLEGIGGLPKILAKTKELGMSAVAVTDYHGMYGAVEFYQKAKKEDIKPLIGVEMQCVYDRSLLHGDVKVGTVVLLAQDIEGYQNLLPLISKGYDHFCNGHPTIDFGLLEQYHQGLYILLGGEHGFFGQMIQEREEYAKMLDLWKQLQAMFGPANVLADLIAQDYRKVPALREINATIQKLAEETDTTMVVHNNFHYVAREDQQSSEVALAVKDGKKMYDEDRRKVVGDYHIMSEQEVLEKMISNGYQQDFVQELMKNNETIADGINIDIELWRSLFPDYETPERIQNLYDTYEDMLVEKVR